MIKSRRRLWFLIAILMGVVLFFAVLVAPTQNRLISGSTFGVSPDGYAAWYDFMKERKTIIERWQKPFDILEKSALENPITLLRIYGKYSRFIIDDREKQWVKQGNTLVILASQGRVTEAPFTTNHRTNFGDVTIETTRRKTGYSKAILEDDFGAIISQEKQSRGQIIYVTTPYLGANAYKLFPGNYQFLAHLVESTPGNKILVDEYIHGYKNKDLQETETDSNVLVYLLNTPLLIILIQGLLIILILIFANNNGMNKKKKIQRKIANNSQEYINALATILQNAKSRDFVLKTIEKAEKLQLQKKLGLKLDPQNLDSLIKVWSQRVGKSPMMLETLLKKSHKNYSSHDFKLLEWMKQWQTIHKEIYPQSSNHDNK
ncbi:DUF4350 domain-containing protein [Crocosphaera sp. Alani8]|uniref:DUF4350 domain-containing protein n=1 Tax=Crocosphaera sp. Alani8 TaxID=3038952 RepID=UPI00313B5236